MTKKGATKRRKTPGFVLSPLNKEELQSFLDKKSKDVLKYYILKSLFSQPEPKPEQRQLPIQVPKEHIEQWFTQALEVAPVGAGSYPIDIYNEAKKWGADIKMLNIKIDTKGNVTNGDSGEASLGQNFSNAGVDLDQLFENRNHQEIKDRWLTLYKDKYDSLKRNHPVKKIYYFFILRPGVQLGGADFYFCGAELRLKELENVKVNAGRTTKTSVFLTGFISEDLGNAKIYKSKKRLELRLKPKNWIDQNNAIKISTTYEPTHMNLRNEIDDKTLLKRKLKELEKISVDFIL